MNLRIVKRTHYNEFCKVDYERFIIEQEIERPAMFQRRVFARAGFIPSTSWKPLRHHEHIGYDVHSRTTEFKSRAEAQDVIKLLSEGVPRDEIVSEVVE